MIKATMKIKLIPFELHQFHVKGHLHVFGGICTLAYSKVGHILSYKVKTRAIHE